MRHSFVVLALSAALSLAACSNDEQAAGGAPGAQMPPPEVGVVVMHKSDVALSRELVGRLSAFRSADVRARVPGVLQRRLYEEGSDVRKGQPLFRIDPAQLQATAAQAQGALAQARANAANSHAAAERARSLIDAKFISRSDYDNAVAAERSSSAAVQAAQAAVQAAQINLGYATVRAPISGRAGRALVTMGNLAQADATLLTTVVSLDPVHVHFEADEQSFLRYSALARAGDRDRSGNPVRVGLANETGYPHAGTVDFIDNQVDPRTGTIRARAVLPNPDRTFTPGLFARVQLQGSAEFDALLIDDKAVLTDQDRKYVYVLGPKDTAVRKDIVTGRMVNGLRVVESGLDAKDKVIVHGVQKVFFPGMPVSPKTIAMGAPPPSVQVAAAGSH